MIPFERMESGQVRRLGVAGCVLLFLVGCGRGTAVPATPATPNESIPKGSEQKSESPSSGEPSLDRDAKVEPTPGPAPNHNPPHPDTPAPSHDSSPPDPSPPDPSPSSPPLREEAAPQGVEVQLDDGSRIIIPYGDEGLDMCSMVRVHQDGERSPHRPPDVSKKCASRWREK